MTVAVDGLMKGREMVDVQWEEPPPDSVARRRGIVGEEFLRELRANPGKWARVDNTWDKRGAAMSYANSVRNGHNSSWGETPAECLNWEFRIGAHPDVAGKHAAWVRWNGPAPKPAKATTLRRATR